jgi:hypothetical protein
VGGAYAAGVSVERIEQEWLNTDLPKVVRSFLPTFPRAGLSSGGELRKYLRSVLGDVRIEELSIPFAAVACDIDTGEMVVLREGPLVDALRASVSALGRSSRAAPGSPGAWSGFSRRCSGSGRKTNVLFPGSTASSIKRLTKALPEL